RAGEVSVIHNAPRVHERIAAEEPCEAGPLARTGEPVTCDQAAAHAIIALPALIGGQFGPSECAVERGIGRPHFRSARQIFFVVGIRLIWKRRCFNQCTAVHLERAFRPAPEPAMTMGMAPRRAISGVMSI